MKLWIDDIRPAPPGDYLWFKDINAALRFIRANAAEIDLIDFDHDAGDFRRNGHEDYIVILREMQRLSRVHNMSFNHIRFRLHSANPVGVQNMRHILQDNGWKEIY